MGTNPNVRYVEELVNTFPPGMEGWRLYRVEYASKDGVVVAEGRLWVLPGFEPHCRANGLRVAELMGENDRLAEAIVDAIRSLNVAENGGDVTEVTYDLNDALGGAYRKDDETGKLIVGP